MIKVGIVGGTGYTGVELLRLLAVHPHVELKVITSRSEAGRKVSDMYANLREHLDIEFTAPDEDTLAQCDVVFFATPHGVAMEQAPKLLERGVKVIDLGADFRIDDIEEWQKWYGLEHTATDWVEKAVYGLPELNREKIKQAQLIACPGCYCTATQLGFKPLVENGLVELNSLVADCKSGTSGAGRAASVGTLFCEVNESFKAYGVNGHRHLPEIKQGLGWMSGQEVGLTFVPHLVPMNRGICATLYGRLTEKGKATDMQALYEQSFKDEPFVDVLESGTLPETRTVKGSNMCRMSVFRPQNGDTLVVVSVIDNLVKGASGQAVQNMNLMFGLEENTGLKLVSQLP